MPGHGSILRQKVGYVTPRYAQDWIWRVIERREDSLGPVPSPAISRHSFGTDFNPDTTLAQVRGWAMLRDLAHAKITVTELAQQTGLGEKTLRECSMAIHRR